MLSPVASVLTKDALALKKLDREVVKTILEGNIENFGKTLDEFFVLKRKIKKSLIENEAVKIFDNKAQEILTKINQDEPFQAEKLVKGLENHSGEKLEFDKLDDAEIEELADVFYSWFSHYEYLEGLYEIGSLIVGISVPDALKRYVSEARECYAFQQYNAVYGLCRLILEVAIRHRCERKGILKRQKGNIRNLDDYRPAELINKSTRGDLRNRVKDIYENTSILLHGRRIVKADDAKRMFKATLIVVQELYRN